MTLTAGQISAFRLARHHLVDEKPAGLVRICRDVCGIQAQLMSAAEMALSARKPSISKSMISSALWKKRELVRTSLMRQTLHIIPSSDFVLYITALKKSRLAGLTRFTSRFGITAKDLDSLNQAIMALLRHGPMSQENLTKRLLPMVSRGLSKYMSLSWGIQLFRPALVEGLICYGRPVDKKVTYVRVDQWLQGLKRVAEDEAKRELIRRYLKAYGPATPKDFSKWSGISMGEVRETWQTLEDELAVVSAGAMLAWLRREDMDTMARVRLSENNIRLLPSFDSFLLGHAQKDHLVDGRNYKRVYRNQGWISPVVLQGGRIIGVWSMEIEEKHSFVCIALFQGSGKDLQSGIEGEVNRLRRFIGASLDIRFERP
ncbi:MAG: AlkZ family DNA glycosylase [Ignavibacteriales bacterium]|nr:AlkZ family DNA glycosylase [Ignavibacteriales bacterium]